MIIANEIPATTYILPLLAAVLIAFITIDLIRRRKLREEYALIWLAASAILLVFGIFPKIFIWIQGMLGVYYLTLIVMGGFFFLSIIVMHLSVVISRQSDEIRKLTQQMAIIAEETERLTREKKCEPDEQSDRNQNRDDTPTIQT